MLIPVVQASDFELARGAIVDFERWATYDDYLCDREGLLIGLAAAGQPARLAPVCLRTFLGWSAMAGVPPNLASLDRFAAMTAPPSSDMTAASTVSDGPTGVSVDLASYRDWLECLGEPPSDAHFAAYAALIRESLEDEQPCEARKRTARSNRRFDLRRSTDRREDVGRRVR